MSISTSNTTGSIELKLIGYHDCDDVQPFGAREWVGRWTAQPRTVWDS